MTAETPKTAVVPVERDLHDVEQRLDNAALNGSGRWTDTEGREAIGYVVSISDFHRIRRALANRDPQAGEAWRPIETAPDETWVLVAPSGQVGRPATAMKQKRAFNDRWSMDGRSYNMRPTHWIPLPASPQDDRMGVAEDGWINGKWCCNPVPGVRVTARGDGFVHAGISETPSMERVAAWNRRAVDHENHEALREKVERAGLWANLPGDKLVGGMGPLDAFEAGKRAATDAILSTLQSGGGPK